MAALRPSSWTPFKASTWRPAPSGTGHGAQSAPTTSHHAGTRTRVPRPGPRVPRLPLLAASPAALLVCFKHGLQQSLQHLLLVQRRSCGCWWHIPLVAAACFCHCCGCCSGGRLQRQRVTRQWQLIPVVPAEALPPRIVTAFATRSVYPLCITSSSALTYPLAFIFCAFRALDRLLAAVVHEGSPAEAPVIRIISRIITHAAGGRAGSGSRAVDRAGPAVLEP